MIIDSYLEESNQALLMKLQPPGLDGKNHRVTSLRYSSRANQVLASYSSDYLYLFDIEVLFLSVIDLFAISINKSEDFLFSHWITLYEKKTFSSVYHLVYKSRFFMSFNECLYIIDISNLRNINSFHIRVPGWPCGKSITLSNDLCCE